jgi:excisionase family DNA binding protein
MRQLSITECARRHGVTRKTIHRAIERGALQAERVGHVWVVQEDACVNFTPLKDPREKGRRGMAVRWQARKAEEGSLSG